MAGASTKVNTIYTAVDKMTAVHQKMERSNLSMAQKMESNLARVERKFRAIGDRANKIGRQGLVTAAAIAAPMVVFANEAVSFEQSMSNVNTLIDSNVEDIGAMGDKILEMSQTLPVPIEELTASLYGIRSAGIDASQQFDVLETAAKLSASGLATTEEATKLLTGAMNTFESEGLSAEETAGILFATVKSGITTVSELTTAFGANAAIIQSAGVSLKEMQAATAALTTSTTPASVAQTQLKAAIGSLQGPTADMLKVYEKLGVTTETELIEKAGGMVEAFKMVNQATDEMGLRMAKVWGSKEGMAAVLSLTGSRAEAFQSTMLEMGNGVEMLNTAYEKQASTAKSSLQIAKNQFQSLSITLGQALLPVINDLLKAVMPMVKSFSAWAKRNKALLGTVFKIAAAVGGLSLVVSGVAFAVSAFTKTIALAKGAMMLYKGAVVAVEAVQWLWNAALAANPIFLVVAAVVAATAAVYALSKAFKSQTAEQRLAAEVQERVVDKTADQISESMVLFEQLRRLEAGTEAYNNVLTKIDQIQPGIIEKYNLQAGALENINAAEKELTKNILKRAEAEVRAELLSEKIKERQKLNLEDTQISWTDALFGGGMNVINKASTEAEKLKLDEEIDILANQVTQDELEKVQPERTVREELLERKETAEKMGITINAEGLPDWIKVHVQPGDFGGSMPEVSPTN